MLNDFSSSNIFSVSITEINYLNKKVDYYNLTFDSGYQLPNECSYYIGLNYTGAKIGVRREYRATMAEENLIGC